MLEAVFVSVASSQGSVLYSQSFTSEPNGYVTSNWVESGRTGNFQTESGLFSSIGSSGYTVAYYSGATFASFEYQAIATGLTGCAQSPPVLGLVFRMQNSLNGYIFWGDIDKVQIEELSGGTFSTLVGDNIGQIDSTGTFNMTVVAQGSTLTAIWNSQYTLTVQDTTFASGYIGVMTYDCNAGFNNLVVTSVSGSTSTTPTTGSTTSTTTPTTSTSSTTTTSTVSSGQAPSLYSSSLEICDSANTCSIPVSVPADDLVLLFPTTGVKPSAGTNPCSYTPPAPVITSVTSSLTWTKRGTSVQSACQDATGSSSSYQNTPFQIYGGEEWYAYSTSSVSTTIVVDVAATTVPNEIALLVMVVQDANPSDLFPLSSPCISTGLSQVAFCGLSPGSGLVVASDASLNGICTGPNFTGASNSGAYIQDIMGEYYSNSFQQTNFGVTFNHNCVDTDINDGATIWVMTADVVG